MNIQKLSDHGYRLTDVFSTDLLTECLKLVNTFTPSTIRDAWDAPELLAPRPDARREVCFVNNWDYYRQVVATIQSTVEPLLSGNIEMRGFELWRDYPGYRQEIHYDATQVCHVMIVYLGDGDNLGTSYFENDKEYTVEYQTNTALLLLNSNKILHGLKNEVDGVDYRRLLYINWIQR